MGNLRERVYKNLFKQILNGSILPGEKLVETKIAASFNVSRMPVRDAILRLQREGLVICKPNTGAFVKKITKNELSEIFDIISELEGYAAQQSVNLRMGDKEIDHLKILLSKMETHAKGREYFQYIEYNSEFHSFIVKKGGNKILQETIKNMRDRIHWITHLVGLTLGNHIDTYMADHQKIVNAISQNDSLKTREMMVSHMQKSKRSFIEALDALGVK